MAGGGQGEAELLRDGGEELVRHLHKHAGAIARVQVAAAAAAVIELGANLEGALDDLP